MADAKEEIEYLHTLSQITRSCLDELTKENQILKKEIQQHVKAREESEARQARDDTRSNLHGLKKENERLKKENERHEKVMEIIDGAINSPLPRAHPEAPPHQ